MAKITFYGAARYVTGSNHLLAQYDGGAHTRMLVDCGLMQGIRGKEHVNLEPFRYDPSLVDALFVTHAHLDHIGRIPRLFRFGFRGPIYSTPATREIAELMLEDHLGINAREARDTDELVFTDAELKTALDHWETAPYGKPISLGTLGVTFRDAGHILGSAMVEVSGKNGKVVFTGDLGNAPNPLIRGMERIRDANYLVMEATYGDREHDRVDTEARLKTIITETIRRGGVLMIPAFSVERTQKLLYELNELAETRRIPRIPVFLDSPLAIKVTDIYRRHREYFCDAARNICATDDEIFKFPGLLVTKTTEDSKRINEAPSPKVIVAGSGMSTGGRILHHERRYLPDEKSTLLLVGFQAAGTMGRAIQDGAAWVTLFGEDVPVRARIETLHGYSAHPDTRGLIAFAEDSLGTLRQVFLVHGEPRAEFFLAQRIRDWLGVPARAPEVGESADISI